MDNETPVGNPRIPASPIEDPYFTAPSAIRKGSAGAFFLGLQEFVLSPVYAVGAGILAPYVCLALQPVLLPGEPGLPGLRFINVLWIVGYGIIGLEILVLAVWLALKDRLGAWNAPISGILFVGGLFAGGLGLVLLPFSVIGLIILIGALGFVPFFTAAAYFVCSQRAYLRARQALPEAKSFGAALMGAVLIVGLPGAVQATASLAVRSAIRDVADGSPGAVEKLRPWYRFAHRDRLVWSCAAERDPIRRKRLADAYKQLTGDDAEASLSALND
ncbi:MAG: hypothetical protein ACYC61_23465 [Isosphaeraceae bacterium]